MTQHSPYRSAGLSARPPYAQTVEQSPEKRKNGKPVIKNTRIPVDLILEKMSEGETIDDLLRAYPRINKEAIMACLAFASESVKNEVQ
ncbi:MAG: DUF433 domain-containing protein [Lewinellaceae bacterium]|nr:DUF433 domain-containing protein [Phaeodactylibacter sp.]MCB9035572.1 DUF433 domain-containing protein [Lewinellaceae bacterium]